MYGAALSQMCLRLYHELFKTDPMLMNGGTIRELSREYFMLSFFGLLRHLRELYVINEEVKKQVRGFFDAFYARWRETTVDDRDMTQFSDSRQQSLNDQRERDLVIRQLFFEYLKQRNFDLIAKDTERAFNEAERIAIYRAGKALCVVCKAEGNPDTEAIVPWNEYEADHVIPHSKGGQTSLENAQLLCRYHNRTKGAQMASVA
jgi:5-methylcytosine-specific restriction endonuclease McrA